MSRSSRGSRVAAGGVRVTPREMSSTSAEIPNAWQMTLMSSSPGLVTPRSQFETVVGEAFTRSANSSCVHPFVLRASRM